MPTTMASSMMSRINNHVARLTSSASRVPTDYNQPNTDHRHEPTTVLRHATPPETAGYLVKAKKFPPSRRKYYFRLHGAALTRHYDETTPARDKLIVIGASCKPHSHNGFVLSLPYTSQVFYARNAIECNMWIDALRQASTFRLEHFYNVGHVIGKGGFAEVRVAIDIETRHKVAVKTIRKSTGGSNTDTFLHREIKIMKFLAHDNVVRTFDIFESSDKYHIVMEFLSAGSLFDIMSKNSRFHEADVRQLMRQVFKGLTYIHSKGIVHRDLKPENILLCGHAPPFTAKIADFGLSNFHDASADHLMQTLIGTPQFVAPELVKNEAYGAEVDAWACGIIIFNMLTGSLPFSEHEVLDKYRSGNFKIEYQVSKWKNISKQARSLTRMLLCTDASKRLNATGALYHAWFTDNEHEQHVMLSRDELDFKKKQRNHLQLFLGTTLGRFRTCVHSMRFLNRLLSKSGKLATYTFDPLKIDPKRCINEFHAMGSFPVPRLNHPDNALTSQASGASVATESEWDFVIKDIDSESQPGSLRNASNLPYLTSKSNNSVLETSPTSSTPPRPTTSSSCKIDPHDDLATVPLSNNRTFIVVNSRSKDNDNGKGSDCSSSVTSLGTPHTNTHQHQHYMPPTVCSSTLPHAQAKLAGSPMSHASTTNITIHRHMSSSVQSSVCNSPQTRPSPRSESVPANRMDMRPFSTLPYAVSPLLPSSQQQHQFDRCNTYTGQMPTAPTHNEPREHSESKIRTMHSEVPVPHHQYASPSSQYRLQQQRPTFEVVTPEANNSPSIPDRAWGDSNRRDDDTERSSSDANSREVVKGSRKQRVKNLTKRLFTGLRPGRSRK